MIRALRGELRKLWGPMGIVVTIFVILFSIFYAIMAQETAHTNLQSAQYELEQLETNPPSPDEISIEGFTYEETLAQWKKDAKDWMGRLGLAAATQHPLGAGGFAASAMGSAMGVFALLFLAAFHVAGEWNRKSIKEVLVSHSGRARFVVVKVVSLWIAGVWLLLVSWVALLLWGLISQHVFPIPAEAPSDAVSWSLLLLAKVPLVILATVTLGVLAGVLLRNPIGALSGSVLAIICAAFVGPAIHPLTKYLPPVWIADWMGFVERDDLIYFLWLKSLGHSSVTTAGLALLGLAVVCTAAAAFIMRRRNVLS